MSHTSPSSGPAPRPSIPEFYAGKTVLITGATGFLGKTVLEKLLRSCPKVKAAYLIVRPKKGVEPRDRLQDIVKSQLFDLLHKDQPDFVNKIRVIPGDLVLEGLGISAEDAALLKATVDVIIHCAATVSFNEKLRLSLDLNVVSVKQLLAAAQGFDRLQAFVHTSTAYSQCDQSHIQERFYEPVVDPNALISAVASMSDEAVERITPGLLGNRPNTYTFTKSLAEDIVAKESIGIRAAVMRPSIVGSVNSDPVPGWQDNINGPGGLYMAGSAGILRVMEGQKDSISDVVPVDMCAAMLLAIGWFIATSERYDRPMVFSCTSGATNPITWDRQITYAKEAHVENEHNAKIIPIFPVQFSLVNNRYQYQFWRFFLHSLPAHVGDLFLRLSGQKPMMKRLYRRLDSSIAAYTPFTSKNWTWDAKNAELLMATMSESDRSTFSFDMRRIEWKSYITNYFLGTWRFIPDAARSSPYNRLIGKTIIALYYVLVFTLFALMSYYLFSELSTSSLLQGSRLAKIVEL